MLETFAPHRAYAPMRPVHLTLHELVLPPSAEWLTNFSGWFFARLVHGLGYVLGSGSVCSLEEGQVVVSWSPRPIEIRASQIGETKLHWFRLCPELLTGFFTLLEQHYLELIAPQSKSTVRIFAAADDLANQFAKLSNPMPQGNPLTARSQMLSIAVSALHDELSDYQFRPDSRLDSSERFQELIGAGPAAAIQELSVAELARQCGCSERHFSRLFRAQFGFSLRARQTELRLQKAQKLLLESNSKVLYVALESGFHHLGLFNALFKKRFGMTPSEWREQAITKPKQRSRRQSRNEIVTLPPRCRD
ncbi:MAG: helix-turn-helix transcriptional regulator [Verrucomicrobiales bacterium]|nr:helix-turn-helix transcriptional regulator [Verrucomicrobiales bacterium]